MRRALLLPFVLLLIGCGPPARAAEPVTAEAFAEHLAAFGLPIRDVTIYTAETDPNQRLGRPRQYVGKLNWVDERYPVEPAKVEIFATPEDMAAWVSYVETLSAASPLLASWVLTNPERLVVLRLHHQVTPQHASDYQWILDTLP